MCILNIANVIKKMTFNELWDFIYDNYYKGVGFNKENTYYSLKRQKKVAIICNQINRKILDLSNANNTINLI